MMGINVTKDIDKAIYYFEQGAKANDTEALSNLGLIKFKSIF